VSRVAKAFSDEQSRVVFLCLVLTGVRRSELRALRWRDVDLIENVLHVRDSTTEDGIRSIALAPTLAEELWQHQRGSAFQGANEYVFAHPERGTALHFHRFREQLTAALKAARVTDHVRIDDLCHTSLTLGAREGESTLALMSRAGHANVRTMQNLRPPWRRAVPRGGRTTRAAATRSWCGGAVVVKGAQRLRRVALLHRASEPLHFLPDLFELFFYRTFYRPEVT
jgi:integrase